MSYFEGINLEKFSYDSYWQERNPELRKKLFDREQIFFDWIEPKSRVLDIAVGNSFLASFLKDNKKCDVYAFDISNKVVELQKKAGVKASVRDISDKNFRIDDEFDYIIASEILEHLSMPEDLLKKIADKTEYILISIPNSAFYRFRLQLFFGRFFKQWAMHPAEHLRFWSHIDFLDWLNSMGLKVIKTEASNGFSIGLIKFYKFWPNLFGHQICYLLKRK